MTEGSAQKSEPVVEFFQVKPSILFTLLTASLVG